MDLVNLLILSSLIYKTILLKKHSDCVLNYSEEGINMKLAFLTDIHIVWQSVAPQFHKKSCH